MLNELKQKIRKAIPELEILPMDYIEVEPIQLNHLLEYAIVDITAILKILLLWDLKSNLL